MTGFPFHQLAVALLAFGAIAAHAQDAATVRIAHVGALTGGAAHFGKDTERGAQLAVDELNAKGVTIGGRKVRLQLVSEDDAGDPRQGAAAAQKLVDSKVQGVVGHLTSGPSLPASRIYSNAGIPQITPSATMPQLTRQGFKTMFRMVADDTRQGTAMAKYAHDTLKLGKVAVIDDRTAYGQGLASEFAKGFRAVGGQVVANEFTNDKAVDFSAILTSIKAKRPDAVFYGGMDAVGGPLLRQMRALGLNVKLLGGDGICTTALPQLAGGGVPDEGVYCLEAGGIDAAHQKGYDDFRARYKAKYNADVQVYAPYAYDAVQVMVAAMEKAGSSEPAKYLPVLAKTSGYPGVSGTVSFDEKGDLKDSALTLYTYRGNNRTLLSVIR
jgi:branched-chain amino acid transport system substrate-binding protein